MIFCRAIELLNATQEEYAESGEAGWVEAAICSLVHDMEVEAEAKEVSLAMQASMQEKEDLEKSQPSLEDEEIRIILERYCDKSRIAATLLELSQNQMPSMGDVIDNQLVIEWLEFERGCYRWYPMSSPGYFSDFSDKLLVEESAKSLEHVLRTALGELKSEVFSFPAGGGIDIPKPFLPYHSLEVVHLENE